MTVLYLMVPIALLLGLGFLSAFLVQGASGQFDDLDTPSHRILLDDDLKESTPEGKSHDRR
jgi:cbb3-type cytochrome oxidase maturation protein